MLTREPTRYANAVEIPALESSTTFIRGTLSGKGDSGSYLRIRATIITFTSSIDRLAEMSCMASSIPSSALISTRRKRSTKACLFVAQDDLRKGLDQLKRLHQSIGRADT